MDRKFGQRFEKISQVAIFVLGTSAILMIGAKNKWGFVFGLASQPFWFYTSYRHRQWGIFAASFIYALNWAYGLYNWWFRPF